MSKYFTEYSSFSKSYSAEDFSILDNYRLETRIDDDGDHWALLEAKAFGQDSRAVLKTDTAAGYYNVGIDYFDETDGVSEMVLLVDGVEFGRWLWDAQIGSAAADQDSLTHKIFSSLFIDEGSEIGLLGFSDGFEPVRIKSVTLEPVAGFEPNADLDRYDFTLNAGDATELVNFKTRDIGSFKSVLQIDNSAEGAEASYVLNNRDGVYDITVSYFDESDGASDLTLLVDGMAIERWVWDAESVERLANDDSHTSRTIHNVRLNAGAVVELSGHADGYEPLRIDKLDFDFVGEIPTPLAFEVMMTEASELSGFKFVEFAGDFDWSGTVLQAIDRGEARAVFDLDNEAGEYDVTVDYFDESDGISEMSLLVDGSEVAYWNWDDAGGSRLADGDSFTSRTFDGISLTEDATVELVGRSSDGEPLRVHSLEFTPSQRQGETNSPEVIEGRSFDGAEGFGSKTVGGRGGEIVHVTNLDNDGEGSLRWALEEVDGPRIVVFDVEGKINLEEAINVTSPFVTIAGQTAPGEGIVVSGARISIQTHDVIMRGMKLRVGDEDGGDVANSRDNLGIGDHDGQTYNVLIDHNSFSWSVDENVSIWGSARDITLSNNIIAEALRDSLHVDEATGRTESHSMGIIVGHGSADDVLENITITKNLLVSNEYRNAYIKSGEHVEFINNYIANYGAGHQGLQIGGAGDDVSAHVIGNIYEDGLSTNGAERAPIDLRGLTEGSHVYLEDNYADDHRELATQDETDIAHGRLGNVVDDIYFAGSQTSVLTGSSVAAHVIENAGARLQGRGLDAVDHRIVNGVRAGSSSIIDSQEEVGGYDVYGFNDRRVLDTDRDGMPDWFETEYRQYGFDKHRADDRLDYDQDGITNIEEYINGLIDGFDIV